ncbi:MAG: questin oxidase family protein [Candidatus Nitrospinota bacterium M3_3B_026]
MSRDTIDRLLRRLSDFSPEFGGGFSNHAAMTMRALKRIAPKTDEKRLEALVAAAAEKLEPWPENGGPVNPGDPESALGDHSRLSGWRDFFLPLTKSGDWREVVAEWAPRLFPGVMAGATHGLIRTAYAVDGLLEAETQARRAELAIALGYWAARFQRLPDGPGEAAKGAEAGQLLEKVERLPDSKRVKGLIFTRVAPLDGFEPFWAVKSWLDVEDPVPTLNGISRAAASLYLQNDGRPAITFIHCLTATHAARMLSKILPESVLPEAVSYLWQAVAALYSADSDAPWDKNFNPSPGEAERRLIEGGWETMLKLAATVNTDHVVKYAWTAFEENRVNPDPVYTAALARWLVRSGLAG